MSKRIYADSSDEEYPDTCGVGTDLIPDLAPMKWGAECDEDAAWIIEDTETHIRWNVCTAHKDEAKAKGIAS